MTIWQPDLQNLKGPDYQRLADAIRRDIEAGRLQPGDRLPPQRDLADTLAMTLGTVTRAYQTAARRGLVAGEVGRGTYVLVPPGAEDGDGLLDLSLNAIPPHAYLSELAARLDPPLGARRTALLEYPPRGGHDDHREAGAEWIARRSVHVSPSQVLTTVGAQHGLLIALSATTSPGDAILVEELTYTGVITAARMLGLKPVPVAIDAEGLRPDALDTVARTSGARTLVIQPSLHNPTGVTMTPRRRREIIHAIHRHGLSVVEDDTYGFLNACLSRHENAGKIGKTNGGGPIWAIFDADAVAREKWDPTPPNVDPNGWFYSASTVADLARKIANPYQQQPMAPRTLEETIAKYNSYVDAGKDAEFGRPGPMFKIQKPPFYAAWATPILHDALAGLRTNKRCEALDLRGQVIPGLYCAGETAGGFALHGLPRVTVFGRIAGREAASVRT